MRVCYPIGYVNPLNANRTKWSNTLKHFVSKFPTNYLSMFDQFVGFALNGLNHFYLNYFCLFSYAMLMKNFSTEGFLIPADFLNEVTLHKKMKFSIKDFFIFCVVLYCKKEM